MTALAGTCRFAEKNNRTRVFALCDLSDRTTLVPISVPGDINVRGIRCSSDSLELELRMGRLAATLRRIMVGLTVPRNHRLGEDDFALRLTFDSGAKTELALARTLGANNRYAILTVLERRGAAWEGRRLVVPQVFPDRTKLGETFKLPSWWTTHA